MTKRQILIVEDNPDTRELLSAQLDRPNYELVMASNGQEAILRVGELAPDVVIMDVMMPELDGLETTRYLKLRFRDRILPIMMLSAKNDRESREEGARFGCEDYRGKPYTKQQLLNSVEALLKLGDLERTLQQDDADDTTRQALVQVRYELAKRLVAEQSTGVARRHLARLLDLAPEHDGGRRLLAQIDEPHT